MNNIITPGVLFVFVVIVYEEGTSEKLLLSERDSEHQESGTKDIVFGRKFLDIGWIDLNVQHLRTTFNVTFFERRNVESL